MEVLRQFGRYNLLVRLHSGQIADVYVAASHGIVNATKLVVLKILREDLAEDIDVVSAFLDEARLAARLAHPHIAQTFEVGEDEGRYYLAMEYLEGTTLRQSMPKARDEGIVVTPPLHAAILSDLLAALEHAHGLADYDGRPLEVVHRDVTPTNVFLTSTPGGEVKLIGFGLARARGRAAQTRDNIAKGTARYMAPEQAMGGAIDQRADVFSVGVMLWEALAGRAYWPDKISDIDILRQLIRGDFPTDVTKIAPTVPARVAALCARALAADPAQRIGSAAELRTGIEECFGPAKLRDARVELTNMARTVNRARQKVVRGMIRQRVEGTRSVADDSQAFLRPSNGRLRASSSSMSSASASGVSASSLASADSSSAVSLAGQPSSEAMRAAAMMMDASSSAPAPRRTKSSTFQWDNYTERSSRADRPAPAPRAPPGISRRSLIAAGSAMIALVVIGPLIARLLGAPAEAKRAEIAPLPPVAANAPNTPLRSVHVQITTLPRSADLRLDGLLVENPFERDILPSEMVHDVVVAAPGFYQHVEAIVFRESMTRSIELRVAPAPPQRLESTPSRPPAPTARAARATPSRPPPSDVPLIAPTAPDPSSSSSLLRRPIDARPPF